MKSDAHSFVTCNSPSSSSASLQSNSDVAVETPEGSDASRLLACHLKLLRRKPSKQELEEALTTPIFTTAVLEHADAVLARESAPTFPQYGLLAGLADVLREEDDDPVPRMSFKQDPRIFFNIAAPSSTFICGSQGSGKSHTLSRLLENCLIPSEASTLPQFLTGLVFHYDTFIADGGGSPCEAAFLSSDPDIKVRVLCSPTNFCTIQACSLTLGAARTPTLTSIQRTYHTFNIKIEPLRISQGDLNTKRMLDLMAVSHDDGPMPLYMHAVYRILREMRIEQQETGASFSYATFKSRVAETAMTPAQLSPLTQRLETLESFMSETQIRGTEGTKLKGKGKAASQHGNNWTSKSGCLTIIDLSCPCVTLQGACSRFNICLSIFLEQDMSTGRVIALDEAHKFMDDSTEAQTLTQTLLSTIRPQRHLGARIIISTQEPTISPALLDLCSVTIVHRFTSPDWLQSLKNHLAAVASESPDQISDTSDQDESQREKVVASARSNAARRVFREIVKLRVGEALLFSPSAMIGVEGDGNLGFTRLGMGFLKVRVRTRPTTDGGKSVMAL